MKPLTVEQLIDYIETHQRGTIDGEVINALAQLNRERELTAALIEAAENIDEYLNANHGLNLVGAKSILHNGLSETLEAIKTERGEA